MTVSFYSVFLNIHRSGVLKRCLSDCILSERFLIYTEVVYLQRCLAVAWLVPRETAAVSVQVLCTPFNHALVYSVTSFKTGHIDSVHVCLAVTCHLHFWQNARDLLRATARR